MKKIFLLSMTLLSFSLVSNAQDIADHALGFRFGSSDGLGAEISYQHALSDSNRIEGDLGWRNSNSYDAFKITGLYQWVMPIDHALNWYVGAGGGLTSFSGKNALKDSNSQTIFVAGDIGLEYAFDFPLQLSLDFRPEIGNNDFTDNTLFDIALGVRYQF